MVTGLLDLLDVLDARGVHLALVPGVGPGPLLQTDAPRHAIDDTLAAAVADHRDMVVAVLLGRLTGHAPAPCTVCGEITLVAVLTPDGKSRTDWPTCRFSSACVTADPTGRHVPRAADIARTATHTPPPAQAKQPAKQSAKRLIGPWPAWPA